MKEIIIFGTGEYFRSKEKEILKKYNIKYFIDNRIKQGAYGTFLNTKIINPNDMNITDDADVFLMSVHFISMWKQLIEIGVNPERIVFPYFEKPYFENDDALDFCLKKIEFDKEKIICISKTDERSYITDEKTWRIYLRSVYRNRYPLISAVAAMDVDPISKQFATERGTPIDRYYIADFMKKHQHLIKGDVLEIEDSAYTQEFGGVSVKNAIVMDVSSDAENVTFNANLETGEGIRSDIADCFILTQTLMYIFDLNTAAKNIGKLLKSGGVALITCSGLSQNSRRCMDNYGCYFNFNKDVFEKMFENEASLSVIEAGSYGNVKTVSAHISGLCCEDLTEEDFIPNDIYYPLIVYAVVKKSE